MSTPNVLNEPIGIIGAGVAGLINAHVLLRDGFTDVTLISRDNSVGGTWARHRVYPGLFINKYAPDFFFILNALL
jgi:dimethylaniline monooxygenase (N-oxide forming)